jgi:peptidoglycan-associated lipoprotein
MKIKKIALVLAVSTAILSGCSSTEDKHGSLLEGELNRENNALATEALDSAGEFGVSSLGAEFSDPANPLSKRTIYFMHDSSQIQQAFIAVVAAHAQYLLSHPGQKVILEGHADELGSREYNIALGEQRAKSVFRMMKVQGVSGNQLEIVSYGEEKPAAMGMDQESLQLNRRVEIAYRVQ